MREGANKRRGLPRLLPIFRVEVHGDSMVPALRAGDRLVVVRTRRLRPGDVAVAEDPRDPARPLVKRVAEWRSDGVLLLGDNPQASTDSRVFGVVPREKLKGRAVYRYAPSDRIGRLSSRASS